MYSNQIYPTDSQPAQMYEQPYYQQQGENPAFVESLGSMQQPPSFMNGGFYNQQPYYQQVQQSQCTGLTLPLLADITHVELRLSQSYPLKLGPYMPLKTYAVVAKYGAEDPGSLLFFVHIGRNLCCCQADKKYDSCCCQPVEMMFQLIAAGNTAPCTLTVEKRIRNCCQCCTAPIYDVKLLEGAQWEVIGVLQMEDFWKVNVKRYLKKKDPKIRELQNVARFDRGSNIIDLFRFTVFMTDSNNVKTKVPLVENNVHQVLKDHVGPNSILLDVSRFSNLSEKMLVIAGLVANEMYKHRLG